MGCLYQPRYRAKDGALKVSAVWWLKYRDATGRIVRESSETDKRPEAKRLLMQREGASVEGRPMAPTLAPTLRGCSPRGARRAQAVDHADPDGRARPLGVRLLHQGPGDVRRYVGAWSAPPSGA
jgi:hypothetical protein